MQGRRIFGFLVFRPWGNARRNRNSYEGSKEPPAEQENKGRKTLRTVGRHMLDIGSLDFAPMEYHNSLVDMAGNLTSLEIHDLGTLNRCRIVCTADMEIVITTLIHRHQREPHAPGRWKDEKSRSLQIMRKAFAPAPPRIGEPCQMDMTQTGLEPGPRLPPRKKPTPTLQASPSSQSE